MVISITTATWRKIFFFFFSGFVKLQNKVRNFFKCLKGELNSCWKLEYFMWQKSKAEASLNLSYAQNKQKKSSPFFLSCSSQNKIFTRFFCVYGTKVLIYSNFLWFYAESCSLRHECYCANTIISPTLSSIACLTPAWYMLMIVKLIARDIVDAVGKNIPSRACYLFKAFCWVGQLHGSTTSSHRRRRAGRQWPSEAA